MSVKYTNDRIINGVAMKINIENTESGDVIFIRADEHLDSTAYDAFGTAASLGINTPSSTAIIIDLGRTNQLLDSGKAMLMTLHLRAGRLKNKLYIANVNAEITRKLIKGKLSSMFHMGKDFA